MSDPRDRDGDEPGNGDWQEPEQLGAGSGTPPTPGPAGPAGQPSGREGASSWQPPGWDLPSVEPERPATQPGRPWDPPAAEQRRVDEAPADAPADARPDALPGRPGGLGGLFGGRRRRAPGAAEQVFAAETDPIGVQAWAMHHGWVPSDGTGPQDAVLAELVVTAPVRASRDHRAGNVVRGRGMGLELVAFDVLYASGRYLVPQWAVTAAPVLGAVPGFRLSPARLWKHGTGGLLHVPSGDPEFDARWTVLAPVDDPAVHRVVADPLVRQLLLGTDDGDELWSAAGHVAVVRPDGHRPQLIEHHARVLAVVVGALAAAS